jgi:hypothetical protein
MLPCAPSAESQSVNDFTHSVQETNYLTKNNDVDRISTEILNRLDGQNEPHPITYILEWKEEERIFSAKSYM